MGKSVKRNKPPALLGEKLALRLLGELLTLDTRVDRPIEPHAERRRSGHRGVSLAFLRAFKGFYKARDALGMEMTAVCKDDGCAFYFAILDAERGLIIDAKVGERDRSLFPLRTFPL